MNNKSLSANVLSSTGFLLIAKFFHKSVGIISLLILARLLDTEDYAIVAICTFVLYLGETLSTLGSESYIIRKQAVTHSDLNTAFTLDFVSKLIIWGLAVVCIPLIASFLDDYEGLYLALFASTSVILINAFKNPGLYLLKKEFNFKGIFYLQLIQKVIAFACTISVAVIYESYWAPILGNVVLALTYVIGSYILSSYRPRFSLSGIGEQWIYSRWLLVRGVIGYLRSQIDTLIVSKLYSPEIVGRYHLVKQVTVLPATDIIGPAILPLMVSFSKVKDDVTKLAYQFRLSLYLTVLIIVPICVYMAAYSSLIVDVILGDKWSEGATIMSLLVIMLFSYAINQLLAPICMVRGKVKQLFTYDLISFFFVVSALVAMVIMPISIERFTLIRSVVAFIPVIVFAVYILRSLKVSIKDTLNLLLPILFAASLSYLVACQIPHNYFTFNIINLSYHFLIFITLYVLQIAIFWYFQAKHFSEVTYTKNLSLALLKKVQGFLKLAP